MDEKAIAKHKRIKLTLKILGILFLIVGFAFTMIGFIDYFKSVNSFEAPKKFWCLFIGFPVTFLGMALTLTGFRREISTYVKNETVPIINETAKDISPAIESLSKASSNAKEEENDILCPKCGYKNAKESKFCNNCGNKLD